MLRRDVSPSRPATSCLFSFDALTTLAPWVHHEIMALGRDRIDAELRDMGEQPDTSLPMSAWVSAVQNLRRVH